MAHRLRLHFGASRSNTAPESELLERDREDDFFTAFHTLPRRSGPHALSRRSGGGDDEDLQEASSLKRSTSMFIPPLQACPEVRPTRSSSVHISLQRADAADVPPERRSPPSSLPQPVPHLNGSVCGRSVRSQQRNSSTEAPLPRPPEAPGAEPRRWSLQHVPDVPTAAGKKFLVLQLQQPPGGPGTSVTGEHGFGPTGTKGNRLVRYPRIRLERSASHPVPPRPTDEPQVPVPDMPGSGPAERLAQGQGCLFKIRPDQHSRQQHFRILVTRGPEERARGSPTPAATAATCRSGERGGGDPCQPWLLDPEVL
ncbi:uncharacterized protein ACNFOS_013440 [Eudromia elegans]